MSSTPTVTAGEDELAGDVAACMLDLPSFGEFVAITQPADRTGRKAAGKISFGGDRWFPEQWRFERERTGRDIVVKPRQIGFSRLEIARDVQFARTHEGVQVVIVVHTEDAKREFFRAVTMMTRELRDRWHLTPAPHEESALSIGWTDTDSAIRIIEAGKDSVTAADKGRSGTIHRLHCTEAAYYKAPAETMSALLNANNGGECVIESTTNGTGNYFCDKVYDAHNGRFEDFRLHFFPFFEHPSYIADIRRYAPPTSERAADWERELRRLGCGDGHVAFFRAKCQLNGLTRTLREYPPTLDAAFQNSGDTWLEPEHLDWLRKRTVDPIELRTLRRGDRHYAPLRIYRAPQEGRAYILAGDPSQGVGKNEAALVVIEHRSGEIVACWDHDRTKPGELGHVAALIGRLYNTALIAIERNAWRSGDSQASGRETLRVLEEVEKYPYERLYRDDQGRLGWATGADNRELIWGDLEKGIEDHVLWSPDRKMVAEAADIVVGPDGRPGAREKHKRDGADDGLFVAWGIARQVRRKRGTGKSIASVGDELESSRFRT